MFFAISDDENKATFHLNEMLNICKNKNGNKHLL